MTPTVVYWLRIGVWLLMAYTVYTYVRTARKRGHWRPRDGSEVRALGGDLISLAFGAFAWYVIETNFQAPIDAVMKERDRTLAGLRFTDARTGAERSLEEMKGEFVLLNIWATWCPPCRREMPDLHRIDSAFADAGATVVALSDEEPQTVRQFLDTHGYRFTTGTFTSMPPAVASIGTRPVTILIDREGGVLDMVVGARGYDFFQSWVREKMKAEKD
jgi:thiol-disulfide isomerase/thioredoxin